MFNFKDWTTLKTASKVAFKKIAAVDEARDSNNKIITTYKPAYTVLEKKVYNPDTGAESTVQKEVSLSELERIKARKTTEKEALQKEITEIGKMITQIKKV